MDHHIGRILDALDAAGQRENTLIVFTADHGDVLGDHGYWFKSLVSYEESIRVPFLVSYPGHIPAGGQTDALQNLVDLAPTFLDYAGGTTPVEFEGVDQRSAWEGAGAVRQDTIVEERPYNTDWNERILVTPTHKLVYFAGRTYGELYDMVADPHQITNLWDDPAHAAMKQAMIARILDHEMNKARPTLTPSKQHEAWTGSV
jgi:uncharacterized sulfatase